MLPQLLVHLDLAHLERALLAVLVDHDHLLAQARRHRLRRVPLAEESHEGPALEVAGLTAHRDGEHRAEARKDLGQLQLLFH